MSSLHVLLAHRLLDHIRRERLPVGHHLTEQSLEPVLGTSRSPIRGALVHLAETGAIQSGPGRRGYYVARRPDELETPKFILPAAQEEADYLTLAHDRLAGRLPAIMTETEAMRRYGLTRDRLRRVLDRAANEGWIERRASKGWSFLPMIDGPEAYAESYELRRTLEPAAMMMPGFAIDTGVLRRLRAQQEPLAGGEYRTRAHAELYRANATFHEAIAGLSNNRFVVQTIIRQNQLRRLVEYKEIEDRERVRRQCEEHIAIIDMLERGERAKAAELLAAHLTNAGREKVQKLREMSVTSQELAA